MLLRFDFENDPLCFRHPVHIIKTYHLNEVMDKFSQVDEAVKQGYYAAGFVSYEAASAFHSYYVTQPQGVMPLLWFALFESPDDVPELAEPQCDFPFSWQSDTEYMHYQQAIETIREHIRQGNTYQTNYTTRLKSAFPTHMSESFYAYLHQAQHANYCAYLEDEDFCLLSASPELFFKRDGQKIITRPMKGTAPKGLTYALDCLNKQILAQSEKDQAENIMIVDLLRNDLSRLALPGTVHVDELFSIENYPTVWQMTSTISATLPENATISQIFSALFPCGSITGAPKASTMEIIAQAESSPREIYCGAIGYITPEQKAIFNVPIRTVLIDKQKEQAQYGVGGGITWDSTSKNEYQEVINKAKVLTQVETPKLLLESLLLKEGEYFLLPYHLTRLQQSAEYFNFIYSLPNIETSLAALKQQHPQGEWKVRVLLDNKGHCQTTVEAIKSVMPSLQASWSPFGVKKDNRLLYHKTTSRHFYPKASLEHTFLLYNEHDEITEFESGNIVIDYQGKRLTPPVECGLLNGTFRQYLLDNKEITEAVISREQLKQADKIWFINSVRKWREVKFNV